LGGEFKTENCQRERRRQRERDGGGYLGQGERGKRCTPVPKKNRRVLEMKGEGERVAKGGEKKKAAPNERGGLN